MEKSATKAIRFAPELSTPQWGPSCPWIVFTEEGQRGTGYQTVEHALAGEPTAVLDHVSYYTWLRAVEAEAVERFRHTQPVSGAYHIAIDEEQREKITAGLILLKNMTGQESEYLISMFQELPEEHAKQPGILQGFCL